MIHFCDLVIQFMRLFFMPAIYLWNPAIRLFNLTSYLFNSAVYQLTYGFLLIKYLDNKYSLFTYL